MNDFSEAFENVLAREFSGEWWQYLLAIVLLGVFLLGIADKIYKLPALVIYLAAFFTLILGAFVMVEMIEFGVAPLKAFLIVAIVSSFTTGPLFNLAIFKSEDEEYEDNNN